MVLALVYNPMTKVYFSKEIQTVINLWTVAVLVFIN